MLTLMIKMPCPKRYAQEGETKCFLKSHFESVPSPHQKMFCDTGENYGKCPRLKNHEQSQPSGTPEENLFSDGQNSPGLGGCLMRGDDEPDPYCVEGQN